MRWLELRRLTPDNAPSTYLIAAFGPDVGGPGAPLARPGSAPISVTSSIEPHGDRWKWENQWMIWGHPSLSSYLTSFSRRHPGPDTVVGWSRDRGKAERQRRRSLHLMNGIAAETLSREDYRKAMRYEESMPS